MPTTQLEHQQELAQAFIQYGEQQFMLCKFKEQLAKEQDKANTLKQKIEKLQKAYSAFLSSQKPEQQGNTDASPVAPPEGV